MATASPSPPRAPDARLAELLDACPSALLVFDDGSTLPASKEYCMIQSPVLRAMISATDAAGAGAGAGAGGQFTIPLPGDKRDDWLAALPYLYGLEVKATWGVADALAELLRKYDLLPLQAVLGDFLVRESGALTAAGGAAAPRSAWRWLKLAADCRMSQEVVERLCAVVGRSDQSVPAGFKLGNAAEPLAAWLLDHRKPPQDGLRFCDNCRRFRSVEACPGCQRKHKSIRLA
jgi:hypothetical protein